MTGKPTAQLNSITSVSSSEVWAAGFSDNPSCLCGQTIVDSWNGSKWTRLKTPNPGVADYLSGISAVSTKELWAVGYEWPRQGNPEPLILRWDGASWTEVSLNGYQNGLLYSVYAPAHDDAWAFGYYDYGATTLALHWDGKSWKQVSFPDTDPIADEVVSVSASSPKDVWAAGGYYCGSYCTPEARLFHWDGNQWSAIHVQGFWSPSWIYSISTGAPDEAWFAGYAQVYPKWKKYAVSNVTYRWNGKQWADVVNPEQEGFANFYGISVQATSDAWVAGQQGSNGTFTMRYARR